MYCSQPMLTLTRSVSEGRNALPRLRFGLVCFSNECLIFGRVEYSHHRSVVMSLATLPFDRGDSPGTDPYSDDVG